MPGMSNLGQDETAIGGGDAPRSSDASSPSATRPLRLVHLFLWTAAVAGCLALLDGVNRWALRPQSDWSTVTLAVALATAFCAWPWHFARRRKSPHVTNTAGEAFWLSSAGFAAMVLWAHWKPLVFGFLTFEHRGHDFGPFLIAHFLIYG